MKARVVYYFVAVMLAITAAQDLPAQEWLKGVGNGVVQRAKQRVKQKVEDKVYQQVDKTVDKAVDKAMQPAEKAVDKALDKAVSAAEKKVKTVTDTLVSAAEAVAQAAEDASVAIAIDPDGYIEDTPAKGISPEFKARFAGRPSGGIPFYPVKESVVMTYATKNAKGKAESHSRTTISSIRWKNETNYSVQTSSELLDEDMKSLGMEPMTAGVVVENGIVSFEPSSLAGQMTEGMEISGDSFYLPDNIEVGDLLGGYKVVINIGGLATTSENKDIKVVGRETMNISGHSIDCYILESVVSVKALGIKSEMVQKTWYGRGVGQVKSENYSKNGKLMSIYELVELRGF